MAATITAIKKIAVDEASIQNGQEREKVSYLVTVSEANATPMEVRRATFSGLPNYNSTHAINGTLVVTNKTAKRWVGSDGKPSKNQWQVECEYSNPITGTLGPRLTGNTANSFNLTISVTGIETTTYTQQAQDEDHTQILNAADDLYPDPIEIILFDEQIVIDFETLTINATTIATMRGKINSTPVTLTLPQGDLTYNQSWGEHCLLLKNIEYGATLSKTDNTIHCWHCRVILLSRDNDGNGWDKTLPQVGYRYLIDPEDIDSMTEYKETPQYLAADGTKLAAGQPIVATEPIQVYKAADIASYLSTI